MGKINASEKHNHIDNQIYTGITLKELEERLARSHKNQFEGFFYVILQWKRLLISLSLGIILICLGSCAWNLQREVVMLRNEIAHLSVQNAALEKQLASKPIATEQSEFIYYHIQSGDNFSIISKRYYGTENFASRLAQINGISINAQLNLGQVIKVPTEPDRSWISED